MQLKDLKLLLVQLLQEKNYKNCQIVYDSSAEFGHGFQSDITFVKVICDTESGEKKDLNLAVKKSVENGPFRDTLDISKIYIQEIYFYSKLFPLFMEFQNKKKVKNVFDVIPKCYATFVKDNVELLILENLKAENFTLCDRKKPIGLEELKLALVEYGKFHAFSLAMKDQEPKLFGEVTSKLDDVMKDRFRKKELHILMPILFQQILDTLHRRNENELYENYKNLMKEENLLQMTVDLMNEETSYSVVNHCDSWINNLMFQYKDEDKTVPSKLAIIDWQLVSVCNTPIYDLSFLLYVCASVEDLENLPDLLKIYYNSLHSFMKELGSDPDKVFPYDTFLSHWRRYRLFGFMIAPMSMKFLFAENEDLPAECKCVEDTYNWIIDVDFQEKGCEDRVVGLCRRYFCNNV